MVCHEEGGLVDLTVEILVDELADLWGELA